MKHYRFSENLKRCIFSTKGGKMKRIVIAVVLVLAVTLSVFGSSSCSSNGYSGPVESITLGYFPSEGAGLVYIAEEQGFFTDNGVKVIHKYYDTGAGSMEALLNNEIDIAGTSEVPVIAKVLEKKEVSIYASLDKLQYIYFVGRKDRGIETVADLKGKRIGLPLGTMAEFYLGRFLELNGLSMQDVILVNTAPAAAMSSITSGNLDGVVIWNPIAYQIEQQLADEATLLLVQSNQMAYSLAVARNDWLANHKGVINRSLKAILQAEQYVIYHPAEAKAIIQKRMKYDDAFMSSVWSKNEFSLSLDQSLVAAMEDEARWMINNNLTSEKKVPDFVNYIYLDGLMEVKPNAVHIIR